MNEDPREIDRVRSRRKAVGLVPVFVVLPIAVCVSILYIAACGGRGCGGPPNMPMPALQAELADLPVRAHMRCSHDANLNRSGFYVWELPGTYPGDDSSSAYQGVRGSREGVVPRCREVRVKEYAWSEVDGEFRVYVEFEQAAGWADFHQIDFDIARMMRAFEPTDAETVFGIVEAVDDPSIRSLDDAKFGGFAIRSHFNVHIHADRLIYVKSPCTEGALSHRFFLHITPVHLSELGENNIGQGLGVRDFNASDGNITTALNEVGCIVVVALPGYDTRPIYTSQVTREVSGGGEFSWKGPIWEGKAVLDQDIR